MPKLTRKELREAGRRNLERLTRPPAAPPADETDSLVGLYKPAPGGIRVSPPESSEPAVSQPTEPAPAGPLSQPALSQPTASLLDTTPDSAGFSRIPNRYFDHLCAHLSPDEQAVYSQLYRLSHGYGKDTCLISNARLSDRSSVPLSTLKRAVARLVGRGLVEKINAVHGPLREQGVTYRVPAASQLTASQPRLSQPTAGHNKERIKDKISKSTVCDLCKDTSGFIYKTDNSVERCKHEKGK